MRSSSAAVDLTNSSSEANATLEPYTTTFTADVNGLKYTFFYVGNYSGDGETEDNKLVIPAVSSKLNVLVYEGKSASIKAPIVVDTISQSANLNEKKIDVRTLRVYVSEADGVVRQYTRRGNINSSTSADERVYFLETTKKGYRIAFGGFNDSDGNRVGRGVGDTERVFVSYVVSSGNLGNAARRFSSQLTSVSISNDPVSSGGHSSPDTNSIKFLATRDFVKSENPITASDYQVAINNIGIIDTNSKNIANNISVYTSNNIIDDGPGKILYSLQDETNKSITNQPTVINQTLRDTVMVGLSLGYRAPTKVDINFTMEGGDPAVAAFNVLYDRGGVIHTKGFNQTISAADISTISGVNGSWKPVEVGVVPYNGTEIIERAVTTRPKNSTIDLKNKLDIDTSGTTLQFRGNVGGNPSFSFNGGFSGTDTSTLFVHFSSNESSLAVGTTLGTVDIDLGLVHFNFERDLASTQNAIVTGVTANYENKSLIYIKEELLATPRASK